MAYIEKQLEHWLTGLGLAGEWVMYLRVLVLASLLLLLAGIVFVTTRRLIAKYAYRLARRSGVKWDDALADHGVFDHLVHILPAIIIRAGAPLIFADSTVVLPFILKLTDAYLIIVGMIVVVALLKVAELGLASREALKDKPLTSYFQLIRIVLYITTAILVLSVLLGRSPIYFLSAFGAMTAILLLIFKDTILGLVASVQISANDMVKVGDWVEMPKFNADGDVLAINLNTVKVQNWDKTITTIPTYYFITDSFKNWRGMVQSGGRRIKRALYVNAYSISFINPEQRAALKKYHLVTDYVSERQKEIEMYNEQHRIDSDILINGRRMTNLGVFRKYVENYLRQHPGIKKDMAIMVRQLAAEDRGIPLELYCFTDTTAWVHYEAIQADVFDHLFAAAGFFGLEIFQQPGGKDIVNAIRPLYDRASAMN